MHARVLSLNVGEPRDLDLGNSRVQTGIFKEPVGGRRHVGVTGIAGDVRVTPRAHGEEHHAVYAYPHEHYGHWERKLGRGPFPPGHFGENLTVSGAGEREVHIGDVVRVGTTTLQIAAPRIPCRRLSAKLGGSFAGTFLRSRRVGYYLRVLETGEVGEGDELRLVDVDARSPTVDDFVRLTQLDYGDAEGLERLLDARALVPAWRTAIEERAQRARASAIPLGVMSLVVAPPRAEDAASGAVRLVSANGRPLLPFREGDALPIVRAEGRGRVAVTAWLPLVGPPDVGAYTVSVAAPTGGDSITGPIEAGARLTATAPRER